MERTRLGNTLRKGILIGIALIAPVLTAQGAGDPVDTSQAVENKINTDGRARVIVRLRTTEPAVTDRQVGTDSELERRRDIAARQQRIREQLRGTNHNVRREFQSLPYTVVEVDAAGLARLQRATGDVAQIAEDLLFAPTLARSIPQIEADVAHAQGFIGSGSVIAIVDTGVDSAHPFLTGRVIDEACFADREEPTDPGSCPNGSNQQFGTGAGVPCSYSPNTCLHGTHVAGIAAGSGDTPGVAPGANLFALQVFHRSTACSVSESFPCARAFTSDITRVFSFKMGRDGSSRAYPESGSTAGFHPASHHQDREDRIREFQKINTYHVAQLPYFLEKLKNTPDGERSLLDNTLVIYGSPMGNSNVHNHKRCPLFFAGKAGGALRGNLHLKAADGTPMANAFLSVLQDIGLEDLKQLGDSTGRFELKSVPATTAAV